MELSYLRYDLVDGYIHNWLVAGPQRIPIAAPDGDTDIHYGASRVATDSGVTETPIEYSRFVGHKVAIGDYEGTWSYYRAQEDHFVDFTEIAPARQLLRAWAATQVDLTTAQDVVLALTSYGLTDIWVNGHHVCHHRPSGSRAESASFVVPFNAGRNTILIRFERVAFGACTLAVALRLTSSRATAVPTAPRGATVGIPTTITPLRRRRELERTFDAAHLNQMVFERNDVINVHFDPVMGRWARGFMIRLQTPAGQTYAESEVGPRPNKPTDATLGQSHSYPDRLYHAVLRPPDEEYVNDQMWAYRALPLWGLDNNHHSDVAYGELVERRFEALKQASRYADDIYAEMAKMAVSWWLVVEPPVILRAAERVKGAGPGTVRELLGLLGILIRFSEKPEFPEGMKAVLEDTILGYDYGRLASESGSDISPDTEADSLLRYTCAVLAGQRLADREFATYGETGAWLCERGQRLALVWLRQRAAGGFAAWDSDLVFATVVAGLIHLAEFAGDDELFELATAMLDKTLYSLALNSFKGVFGSTRGLTETGQSLHGMLEATSGISRLMWGMGTFNKETTGYVSLACADQYGFPQLIQEIAADLPETLWSHERHAPVPGDALQEARPIDKVMYRTPDYMLSSVQDHRPGEAGSRELVWRATLGPGATVFTNHPVCSSYDVARRPNYWRGNGVLPRIAQWQDALIAVYALPEDDWMGFTHAYFPLHAFDAHAVRDGWAFAQKDDGYLALTASRGIVLLETGTHAHYELRSYGRHNVWLCQMGRAAQDGTFLAFQEAVLGRSLAFDDLGAHYTTLRGDALSFGWQGDLLRNGEVEPLRGVRHFDSPYGVAELPADEMFIAAGKRALRLNLR